MIKNIVTEEILNFDPEQEVIMLKKEVQGYRKQIGQLSAKEVELEKLKAKLRKLSQ